MASNFISIKEAAKEEKKRRELDFDVRLSKQESLSWKIVLGVVVAFIFTIGLVGTEVIFFHTRENKDFLNLQNQYFQEVQDLQQKNHEIELRFLGEINELRALLIK